MKNLVPLVLAARMAKEKYSIQFIKEYLSYHWNIDLDGEGLTKRDLKEIVKK